MALEDDINFLDRVPTLHLLGREALRLLAISVETMKLSRGDILFEEGQPADGGYVVVNGELVLQGANDRKGEAPLKARRGMLIGETAMITDTTRPSTAIATESTIVFRIPRVVFMRILEGEPQAAVALRRLVATRVGRVLNDLDVVRPLFEEAGEDYR
ncbi:MAG TPA: cyclic nucleotide-binding domain-containing protein [Xanthobacteraceae bacterium]|jgi:CRP-like cAMP-binding protein|nr:cyclic nucleotide-binding domain-containing protein [Xanthobacteraceae bacterium]